MRISFIAGGIFPYVLGGMQKHSYYLCKFLAQRKIHIDLYHTNWQTKYDISTLEFFTAEEKKYISSIVIPYPETKSKLPGHYLREQLEFSNRILEAYKKRPPTDFIYTKGLAGWAFLKAKEKGMHFPPIANKSHGYEMYQKAPNLKTKLQHFMLRPVFKFNTLKNDYIFSYGGKITSIIKSLGFPNHRIIEIPTGIEREWITTSPLSSNDIRSFVFLGRFERRKGIQELQRVLKKMIPSNDFICHFVGPIPKDKQIKSPSIKYHGKVTDIKKLQSILQGADVMICPSYAEGMPNVILEGMASGLAVIATDVGACNFQVDEKNGWLISPGNTKELEQAIRSARSISKEELLEFKQNSIKRVEQQFLWKNIAAKTINQMNRILDSNIELD